tara:strand:- start:644 stop:766 length:123 start_codon:yes stop_codon:yes gene_type:complete
MTITFDRKCIRTSALAIGLLFFAGYGVGNIAAKIVQAIGG